MKLKIQKLGEKPGMSTGSSPTTHTEAVLGVGWLSADEVLSCSDDHHIFRWNVATGKTIQTISLASNKDKIFPTSMQIAHKSWSGKPLLHDTFLVTSTDGKVHLINTSGKVEKAIEAHQGAALCARWSNDDSGFVSCGEDGAVKMWSKSAMLRSVLANNGRAVYAVDWNPQSTKVAYCSGEECFIKMLKAQTSPIKWKAHQGTVLCLQWSSATDLIVTGGEDCKYRLWDGLGRPLYTSNSHNYPITTLAWNTTGELFAVGSYNILRLCDKAGWSHSLEKLSTGTIYNLSWSADGTQLVAGCANGSVYHAQVIEKRLIWENLEAVQTKRKTVDIRDIISEVSHEKLETRDRVTKLKLGFNYLVVATTKQFYIFSAKNWNTPVIVDLKEEGSVSLVLLCQKYFLIVLESGSNFTIQTFNYDGRVQSSIRMPGLQTGEPWNEQTAAISNDLVVIRDKSQHHSIHLFETQTGKSAGDGKISHITGITEVAVNQCGQTADRRIAFVDANSECWLALVNSYGAVQRAEKLGSLVSNLCFNTSTNMLSAFQDQKLVVFTFPSVVFTDKDLLPSTMLDLSTTEGPSTIGKSAFLVGFIGNTVTVRRADGCLTAMYVPPFVAGLIKCVTTSKWDQAVRICRAVKEDYLWASLAGMAAADKNYVVAEICYGQLLETEKVLLLGEIRGETDAQLKNALMALFNGNTREADMALVQSGRLFRAIMVNLAMFRFDRALELALKSNSHLDTVLGHRQRFLEQTGRRETDVKFLKHLSKVEIDWPHIREKIQEDEEKERRAR